jgi:hypothetical protein
MGSYLYVRVGVALCILFPGREAVCLPSPYVFAPRVVGQGGI